MTLESIQLNSVEHRWQGQTKVHIKIHRKWSRTDALIAFGIAYT